MDKPSLTPAGAPRYRALFIGHKGVKSTAVFQAALEDEWAETLGQYCDLHIINDDFDYAEVCDRIKPDFVVFKTPGGYRPIPVVIKNGDVRPDIPVIGIQAEDPHDTARPLFLKLIDELKIDQFFVLGTAYRQSPEMALRAVTMSMFIDGAVFHDYGEEKIIPVSIFGGLMAPNFYNWRLETFQSLVSYFPTFLYTHPGYDNPIPPYRFPITGVDYAKMVNRSRFSLSDGTREAYVVRKHLEIPAAGAILVAPDFPELACYGFRDMENCVLGSGAALMEKIAQVANDPAFYKQICTNGHDLVHARFTRKSWRWIIDWYECRRGLRPGEMVQQQGIFGPFKPVPAGAHVPALLADPLGDSEFAASMKHAVQRILDGQDLSRTETLLKTVSGWMGHASEPYLLLGIVMLLQGQIAQAREMFLRPQAIRQHRDGVSCFDPEEIAWLWMVGSILGDGQLIALANKEAEGVRHLSLRRMSAMRAAQGGAPLNVTPELLERKRDDRISIHWTGQFGWDAWLDLMRRVLAANKK